MLFFSLRGVNRRFWTHLGCSGLFRRYDKTQRFQNLRKITIPNKKDETNLMKSLTELHETCEKITNLTTRAYPVKLLFNFF